MAAEEQELSEARSAPGTRRAQTDRKGKETSDGEQGEEQGKKPFQRHMRRKRQQHSHTSDEGAGS